VNYWKNIKIKKNKNKESKIMDYQRLILPAKGKVCDDAIYIKQRIPNYTGNPLIEALPPILTTKEAMKKLAHYPVYNESMRNLPDDLRYQLLEDIVQFFTPLNIHLDLERRISRVIRTGLIERNPMKTIFWQKNGQRAKKVSQDSISQYGDDDDFHSTSAYGFNAVGISGIGKSLTFMRILRLFPQVIHHSEYYGQKFTFSQIVWLKLDCPFDGGLKGLCINFFQTIDSILGTSYHKNYASKSRNTDEMLPYMALVAANHGIGVLVIDEIQRLSLAKSGGIEKMLNFFVQLVNTVGVPVILVGTYKSLSVFEGNFSQMRRGTGQGDLVWDRMKHDKEWELFVKAMWQFQYTRQVCSLDKNPQLTEVLYDETQGITDLAVKAYMLAQERAIETKKELVDAPIIRSVCHDKFRMLRPALEALKSKTKNALTNFEDAYPKFLEQFIKEPEDSAKNNPSEPLQISGEITSDPQIRSLLNKNKESENSNKSISKKDGDIANNSVTDSLVNLDVWLEKVGDKNQSYEEKKALLPSIFTSLEIKTNKSVHALLNEAGFIRSGSEFMAGGNSI
jgi:hypothetical protein